MCSFLTWLFRIIFWTRKGTSMPWRGWKTILSLTLKRKEALPIWCMFVASLMDEYVQKITHVVFFYAFNDCLLKYLRMVSNQLDRADCLSYRNYRTNRPTGEIYWGLLTYISWCLSVFFVYFLLHNPPVKKKEKKKQNIIKTASYMQWMS